MEFSLHMHGHGEFRNITNRIAEMVNEAAMLDGIIHIFAKHTTVAVIIADDEDGLKQDFIDALERLVPEKKDYRHNSPGDMNAHAHIKSMLCGCGVTVPIRNGKLDLGTWQRIFLVDFDTRARERSVCVTILES